MRAVLDTNVIIAPFLSPKGVPSLILKAWEEEAFELVVSEVLLVEYKKVLAYPRVAAHHNMDKALIEKIIDRLKKYSIVVAPKKIPKVVEADPDDDQLFAAALIGEASFVVSKDRAVLGVGEYKGIQVLNPLAFLTVLQSNLNTLK